MSRPKGLRSCPTCPRFLYSYELDRCTRCIKKSKFKPQTFHLCHECGDNAFENPCETCKTPYDAIKSRLKAESFNLGYFDITRKVAQSKAKKQGKDPVQAGKDAVRNAKRDRSMASPVFKTKIVAISGWTAATDRLPLRKCVDCPAMFQPRSLGGTHGGQKRCKNCQILVARANSRNQWLKKKAKKMTAPK